MSKQTAVQLILHKLNLLSDNDFKSWMLNHYDELIQMEHKQITDAYSTYAFDEHGMRIHASQYYKQTYGGKDE